MIFKWNLKDGERKDVNPKKLAPVNDMCVAYDTSITNTTNQIYSILLAVEDPESLREFSGVNNIIRTEAGPIFGCVVKSSEKKMIFAGVRDHSKDGSIYFFRHPLSSKETDISYAHNSLGVSKMILTPKDRYLVTGGMDGTIIIFQVEDKNSGAAIAFEFKEPCPNILVTQSEINDLANDKALLSGHLNNEKGFDGTSNERGQDASRGEITGGSANDSIKANNEFHKMKLENDERLESLRNELRTKEEEKKKLLETEMASHKSKVKELEVFATTTLDDK